MQYDTASSPSQGSPQVAQHLAENLSGFLAPLLTQLDAHIDRRLVRTFLHTIAVIITFRHRAQALLLSELERRSSNHI